MSSAVLDTPTAPAPASPQGGRPRTVRRDLEGLRAVAVIGVVVYHLRASWLPGGFAGVDAFFVLSGFFITGLLLREAEADGRVDLRAFWGRRARRLLPVSAFVVLVTLAAGAVLADAIDAQRFAAHGGWVALFAVNWRLAAEGTDYLADKDPTPFQHYWSLGVEEQFYLVLPLIVLGVALLVRRRRSRLRPVLVGVIVVAALASFGSALHESAGNQPYAYFGTGNRVWQLGLGAVLAGTVPWLARLSLPSRFLVRLTGMGLIVGFYVLAPLDIVYPGWFALCPTLGAGLVIAGGVPHPRTTTTIDRADLLGRALASRPGQLVGRYSYGWYLWHWPPLVLIPLAVGHRLAGRHLVLIGTATLALAVVTYHLIEQPVRSSGRLAARRGRGSLVLAAALVTITVAGSVVAADLAERETTHADVRTASGRRLDPQPAAAMATLPRPTLDGCEVSMSSTALSRECRYRTAKGGAGEVVLLGDSHAAQWFPAVDAVAREHGWGLRVWTRASCPVAAVTKVLSGGPNTACNRWRDDVMKRVVTARPRLVIIAGYASVVPSLYDPASGELVRGTAARTLYRRGLTRQLRRLRAAGSHVLLIRDNPSFDVAAPKCVLEHPDDLDRCAASFHHALRTAVDLHAARAVPGVHVLDLTGQFCSATRCAQVLGDVLAYRDTNHLTVRMVDRLEPRIATAARTAFG